MEPRENVGHMDFVWEKPQDRVDKSSPWVTQIQQPRNMSQPNLSTRPFLPKTFGDAAKQKSPLRMQSFQAPSKSLFDAGMAEQNSATFRRTAFTTPAFSTPRDNRFAEMDVDDSPAMTETPTVAETPDFGDRSDMMEDLNMSSPEQIKPRVLWPEKRSGKGPIPRATGLGFAHDRVRKRPRVDRDKDIGSTRSRLPGGCDEDDSEYEAYDDNGRRRRPRQKNMGFLHYILATISANPEAPVIFSYYLQLFIDTFLGGLLVWVVWGTISSARGEVIHSVDQAKLAKNAEIEACAREYTTNKCSPIAHRLPALHGACNEWEKCMNQDPNSVAGVKASLTHLADIINDFTTHLTWKSIFVIMMVVVAFVVANNIAFSKFRQSVRHFNHQRPADAAPSHPAMTFPMSPQKPDQAYIFAPIGHTPKHIRRAFFQDDTDTDASPDPRLLPPPGTPSRRSPSKGERSRSPSKRITSRGY